MFKDLKIMKTNMDRTLVVKNIIANNTVINMIMKAYLKYICAVVLLIGTSASAWGTSCTLKIWDKSAGAYRDWMVIDESYTFTNLCDYPNEGSNYYCVKAWAPSEYGSSAYPSSSTFYYQTETYGTRGTPSVLYAVYQDPYADPYSYTSKPNSFQVDFNDCTNPSATVSPTSKSVAYEASAFSLTASRLGTGTVTWTSSNTSVASLSSTSATGATVTPGRAGTATITYSVAEKGDYCAGSATCEVTVTAKAPTVSHNTTSKVLEVSAKTARTATFVGGVVTNDGGADIAKYGFVVGTTSGVTVSTTGAKKAEWNTSIAVGTKYGSKGVTGLSPNTTYYVRAYAKNSSSGTYGYSTAISFTTLNEYTISYDNNGGSGSISPQKKEEDATAVLNGGASFSKTGYDLSGWNTADDGTGDPYDLGDDYTANADATMYAVWTPAEYTITLNDQSATTAASPTSLTATYNASTGLTGTVVTTLPTKTGYTFGGYYTSTGGEGVQVIAADGTVNASANDGGSNTYTDASKNWKYANDITLYAKWTAKSISLTLNKNGVTGTDGSATITFNEDAVNSSPTHATNSDGTYSLAGYYSESTCAAANKVLDASGNVVNSTVSGYTTSGKWTRDESTTLYAKWSKTLYTVSFNMQGHGSSIDDQEVESGEKAIEPETPTAEDYHFAGWYKEYTYDNEWDFDVNTVSGNTTLYAKWEDVTYSSVLKAWCDPDIEITGDIHLTSANGIAVYATSTTNNLLTISSEDLSGVDKLDIKYLDADNADAEVAPASSLFRLCNDGSENYNTADGSQINVSASNTCDLSYSIRYTPSAHGVINHYKLQITMKRGTRAVKTVTHDLYGRSLPEEFVVASKFGGEWYALPNTLEATEVASRAVAGVKITVDNTTTPTAATYAPDITVYQGEGRYAANSNRYGVRLTDGTNHLQVSTTGSNNKMWLSSTGSAACQDWWLSSTNFGAYSVTIPSNTGNETKKIGMDGGNIGYYASPTAPSEQIYFLPITNKLVDNDAIVTEWGQKSVILDVDAQSASGAQARIGSGAAEKGTFSQTRTSVAGSATKYNYTVSFSTTDFSTHKGELLYIDWLDEEDNVISTSAITIPWIIAENTTMSSISTVQNYWKDWEIHVLPGNTFTADGGNGFASNTAKIRTLEIYPGATVNVTSGILDVTQDLVLRNGWTRANGKSYDVARLYIPTVSTLKTNHVYADWYIDFDQYYPVAVPWSVTTSGMSYKNSNSAASAGVKMRYYDGASRADNGQTGVGSGANWKAFNDGVSPVYPATLTPGVGYAMTARRPTGKAFSIIRMPLTIPSAAWTTSGEQGYVSSTHKDEVSVIAHGVGEDKPAYTLGWNFIANPYMSIYQGPITHSEGSDYDVEYVNIPDLEFKNYGQYPVGAIGKKLLPASGFFIQAAADGVLTFGTSNRKASAPSFIKEETTPVVSKQKAYIVLNNEDADDMMGLIVSERYTEAYEINADLEKLLGDGNDLKTYMRYGDMNMAYVAINSVLAQEWIPVTIQLPEGGAYTFSLHEASVVDELEGVYLIDYAAGNVVTNLLDNSYSFGSAPGIISGRFAINAIVGERQTPTDIDVVNSGGDLNSDKPVKFLYRDKVYIYHRGIIYDATGKRVREINK